MSFILPFRHLFIAIVLIAMGSLLSSTASIAQSDEDDDERSSRPEPVSRICFARSINNFRAVRGEDDVILLERGVNDWYRVSLLGGCSYRRIRTAQAIGIRKFPGTGCLRKGDQIILSDSFTSRGGASLTQCRVVGMARIDIDTYRGILDDDELEELEYLDEIDES